VSEKSCLLSGVAFELKLSIAAAPLDCAARTCSRSSPGKPLRKATTCRAASPRAMNSLASLIAWTVVPCRSRSRSVTAVFTSRPSWTRESRMDE
jgi:hypothetical protein